MSSETSSALPAERRGRYLGVSTFHAAGIWFVPFVNFTRPFELTRQMLVGSGGSLRFVGAWQALGLLGNVSIQITSAKASLPGLIVSNLLLVDAALAAASVVDNVTRSMASPPEKAEESAPA